VIRLARLAAALAGVVLVGVHPGRAAADPVDLAAFAGSGAALHVVEGGTAVVSFGFTGLSEDVPVTVDVDLGGLPASVVPMGDPSFAGEHSCSWWGAGTGFTCEVRDPSGAGSLTVTVPLGSAAGAGLYSVSVRADVDDPDLSNNTVARTVLVDRAARTDLALSFVPGAAAVGEVANVRLVVRNNGPDGPPAWNLSVVAPSGTEYLGCQPVGCESLSIGVGQEYEIVLPFRVTSATVGDGAWSIPPDAGRLDPVPDNNVLPMLGSLIHVTVAAPPADQSRSTAGGAAPTRTTGAPATSATTPPPTATTTPDPTPTRAVAPPPVVPVAAPPAAPAPAGLDLATTSGTILLALAALATLALIVLTISAVTLRRRRFTP
jgi:hypothetical protein